MRFGRAARIAGWMARAGARASAVTLVASLAACGQGGLGGALGMRLPPPDEFQVIEYEPPVIPESYSLPEPRPGTRSPRAPNAERAAVTALLGPEAAARAAASGPSRGEQVLLSAAGAASASSDIRVQLEEDKQAEDSGEYEPPLLWDLLGVSGSSDGERIDESQVLDPQVESERLQQAGVATAVDPEAAARARAEAEREARREETEPLVIDRIPTNRIGPEPEPAF